MFVRKICFFCALILVCSKVYPAGTDWYLSNGSGMLLEKTVKTRALRSKYAIALMTVKAESVPKEIRKYYSAPWRVECRILYEDSKRIKTQWVFKDIGNVSLFVAVISDDGSGFLEWYDDNGFVVEEQRLSPDGSGFFVAYTYKDLFLLKAEAHIVEAAVKKNDTPTKKKPDDKNKNSENEKSVDSEKIETEVEKKIELAEDADLVELEKIDTAKAEVEKADNEFAKKETVKKEVPAKKSKPDSEFVRNPQGPAEIPSYFVAASGREGGLLWADNYRYTRTDALRAVERKYYGANTPPARITFPRFIATTDREFVEPSTPIISNFLNDVFNERSDSVTYTMDKKQRLLTETRRDSEGNIIGELSNQWTNDRIEQISWKSKDDERVIIFGYDRKGDRISEKDYKNGVLERVVTIEKDREVEELYLRGEVALRAIWENGSKVSEQRISGTKNK